MVFCVLWCPLVSDPNLTRRSLCTANGTYICDNACYDKMCAQDATDFYSWAKSDARVVAISPWNWLGCSGCNGSRWTPPKTCCMDEIGARDQPLTRAAWFKIGAEIKKNAQ